MKAGDTVCVCVCVRVCDNKVRTVCRFILIYTQTTYDVPIRCALARRLHGPVIGLGYAIVCVYTGCAGGVLLCVCVSGCVCACVCVPELCMCVNGPVVCGVPAVAATRRRSVHALSPPEPTPVAHAILGTVGRSRVPVEIKSAR